MTEEESTSRRESFGMLKIVGNDGIRVVRTIRVDMVNGFFQGVNDLNRKYRSVVFFGPVGFCYVFNRTEIFQDGFRSLIAAKLHAFLEIDRADLRQERSGNFSVDQQRFHGVAGRIALRFGIVADGDCHIDIGAFIHVGMADAIEMLDHRNGCFLHQAGGSSPCRRGESTHRCIRGR